MILDWSKVRVFVKPGPTDMRKQINGLSIIVSEQLKQDIFEGNLFLFCNKQKRILKIIYWEKNGFCLWLKRLERDKFPWPGSERDHPRAVHVSSAGDRLLERASEVELSESFLRFFTRNH